MRPHDRLALSHRFLRYCRIGGGCWPWIGKARRRGYGAFYFQGRWQPAHRISLLLWKGVDAGRGVVRHTCDSPSCVNPSHLLVGSPADNSRDMVERGRSHYGQRNGRAKVTDDDVRIIRMRCAVGELQRSVADAYGIGRSAVQRIVYGKNWGHV